MNIFGVGCLNEAVFSVLATKGVVGMVIRASGDCGGQN